MAMDTTVDVVNPVTGEVVYDIPLVIEVMVGPMHGAPELRRLMVNGFAELVLGEDGNPVPPADKGVLAEELAGTLTFPDVIQEG